MQRLTIITFEHKNIGGYLFEKTVINIFKKYEIIHIKNTTLIESTLLEQVNNSKAIIIAGGPIIGNLGAYNNNYWMGFLRLNPKLNLIKVPIILFGVGAISIPFKSYELPKLESKNSFFLRQIHKIYTRDYLTYNYLKSNSIESEFMGCPSLAYNNNEKLIENKVKFNKILFSPSIFINNKDNECYNKLLKYGKVIISINHDDKQIENKAKSLFKNSKIIRLTNIKQMIELNKEVDVHIGFRVHQHISSLLAGVKSLLVVCDNRGKGMAEVLGNNKYHVNDIDEIDNKINFIKGDNYDDIYSSIKSIRLNIKRLKY